MNDWPRPKYEFCPHCTSKLYGSYHCLRCGRGPGRPEELEVINAVEQNGRLWIDLFHLHVRNEYNYDEEIMLDEDDARRLIHQLETVFANRGMPPAPSRDELSE